MRAVSYGARDGAYGEAAVKYGAGAVSYGTGAVKDGGRAVDYGWPMVGNGASIRFSFRKISKMKKVTVRRVLR